MSKTVKLFILLMSAFLVTRPDCMPSTRYPFDPNAEYGPAHYYVNKGTNKQILSFVQEVGVKDDEFFFSTPYVLMNGLPIECEKCEYRAVQVTFKKGKMNAFCDKHAPDKYKSPYFTRVNIKYEEKPAAKEKAAATEKTTITENPAATEKK